MKTKLTLAALVLSAATAWSMSADEIVNKANEASYYAGNDGSSSVKMEINDANGGTRVREFAILRKNTDNGNQKFYVYFKAPSDVRKTAYLVWKDAKTGNDDRWLYMPALNLVKRIAPGDKRTSFMGSHFAYEDVSGRSPTADTHELLETTDTQFVIKNVPKDAGSVEFSEYTVWIDKDTFLPRKAEYKNQQGKLYRRVSAVKVETIDGHPTVIESKVEDLDRGGNTLNTFSKVKYDLGLNERIFSERFLRRPPREVQK